MYFTLKVLNITDIVCRMRYVWHPFCTRVPSHLAASALWLLLNSACETIGRVHRLRVSLPPPALHAVVPCNAPMLRCSKRESQILEPRLIPTSQRPSEDSKLRDLDPVLQEACRNLKARSRSARGTMPSVQYEVGSGRCRLTHAMRIR